MPYVSEVIDVTSVLDVGCGQGAWLSVWKKRDDIRVAGLDGHYVNPKGL
ncbi:class I SAM-dependent methyltransferase [Vibrio fortis]|nr:class I SAM-dependent methyltransferase [Vibrio fortis]